MRTLVQLKNLGGEPSTKNEHVIDCADAFVALYNVAMSRLDNCSDKDERKSARGGLTKWRCWG
jgi:hypothetical protein